MNKLLPNQTLGIGQFLESNSGRFRLVFQGDGNVVLTLDGNPVGWSTNTQGTGADTFAFQGDGNAVVYAKGSPTGWNTGTQGTGATEFVLQDDGNLVIYAGTSGVWASGTQRSPIPAPIVKSTAPPSPTKEEENPLRLKKEWYGNCIGNGDAVLKSTKALDSMPQVRAILLAQNLRFGTEGLYPSPFAEVPSLAQLEAEAEAKAFAFSCPRLWGSAKCDNHRNELKTQYLKEAKDKFNALCAEGSKNEALMMQSVATKAGTEVVSDKIEKSLSPEARAAAEEESQKQQAQTGWILLGVLAVIGILVWQIVKK